MADDSNDLGGKVGLDVTDFKAGIAELNRGIRVIESGFKAAAAGMDDWGKSEQGLQTRINALNEITDLQRKKVEALSAQYKKVAAEKGEDSKAAQDLQIKLNKETEALNKNQKELNDTTSRLNEFGREAVQEVEKTEKLNHSLEKLSGGLKSIGGAVGKAAVAGVAAIGVATAAAAAGIWKAAEASSEYADGIQKAADVTGLTAERVQELTYAGANLGVEFDTMAGAQAKLIKSMDAARKGTGAQAEAFKALKVNAVDPVTGALRDSNVVFQEVITKLGGVKNETERDALAMKLFGKSAMELNPLIKAGGDELARLTAEAQKNGAVLSGEQIAALDAFGDSLGNLKMSAKGLAANITMAVLPAFNSLIGNVQTITSSIGQAVKSGDWSKVGDSVSEGLNSIVGQVTKMLPGLASMASKIIGGISKTLVTAVPQVLPAIIDATLQLLRILIQTLVDNGPMLITAGVNALVQLIQGILDCIPQLIQASIKIIIALVNGISAALPKLIPAAVQAVLTIIKALVDNLPQLIQTAITLILALLNGILKALPLLYEQAPQIITSLMEGINSAIPQLIDAAILIIMAIVDFLINNIDMIIKTGVQIQMALIAGILKAIPKLVEGIFKIRDAIKDKIMETDWIEVGLNIIKGMASGISNGIGYIADAAKSAAKSALNAAKSFLGIHSPSRVMRDQVGLMIGQGMAVGIEDSTKTVNKAMAGLNKQVVSSTSNVSTNDSSLARNNGTSSTPTQISSKTELPIIITNFYNNRKQDIQALAEEFEFFRKQASLNTGG